MKKGIYKRKIKMKRRIDYIKESILNILEEIKPATFSTDAAGETRMDDRSARNAGRFLNIARRLEAGQPVKLHGFSRQQGDSGQELQDTPHNAPGDLAKMSVARLQGALRAHGIAPTSDSPHDGGWGAVKRYGDHQIPQFQGRTPMPRAQGDTRSPRTSGFVGIPNTSRAAGDYAGTQDATGVKRASVVGADNKPVVPDAERATGADLANRARKVINLTRTQNVKTGREQAAAAAQAAATRGKVL